jgi:hypothetical protein
VNTERTNTEPGDLDSPERSANPYAMRGLALQLGEEARQLLQDVQKHNATADRLTPARIETRRVLGESKAELAAALANRAELTDPAAIKAMTQRINKLRASAAEVAQEDEGLEDAEKKVLEGLEAFERRLFEFKAMKLGTMTATHAQDIANFVMQPKLLQALIPLLEVRREAQALRDATNGSALARWLNELRIPSFDSLVPLIDARTNIEDEALQDLADADWRSDPSLVAAHDAAKASQAIASEVRAYVARKVRMNPPAPYVRKGYTTEGVTQRAPKPAPLPGPPAPRAPEIVDANVGAQLNSDLPSGSDSEFNPLSYVRPALRGG